MSKDDKSIRKYSRRGALGLMGIGGAMAVSETIGFSNLSTKRGVSVNVVDDGVALLEITANGTALNNANSTDSVATIRFKNDGQTDFGGDASIGPGSGGLGVRLTVTNAGNLNTVSDGSGDSNFAINDDPSTGDFEADTDLPTGNTAILELENNNDGGSDTDVKFSIEADGLVSVDNITRNLTVNNI